MPYGLIEFGYKLTALLQDNGVKVSGILTVIAMVDIDLAFRIVCALPPFVYMCFKIYREFIKKPKQ